VELETVQEYLSTKITIAVHHHIKQYKTQVKGDPSARIKIKDTTASELEYLYLFK